MIRLALLTGAGWGSPALMKSLLLLITVTVIVVSAGILMFRNALLQAEKKGGIGVVV